MHELGLALELVDACVARAKGDRVTRIVVEVGALAAVMPEALRFSFTIAAEGTCASGAELVIERVPATGVCRACGNRVRMMNALDRCACGAMSIELESGTELRAKEMSVARISAEITDENEVS